MIPIHTRKLKPTREDVTKVKNFQTLVENWLVSDAHALMNLRHLDKETPLDSGNRHHVSALALWMDKVATQEFRDDTTSGPQEIQGKYRLSLDKIFDSNERRAKYAIEHWDRSKVEGRSQGGKHGASTGTRKGPTPGSHMATSGRTGTFRHASGCQRRWLGRRWLGRG